MKMSLTPVRNVIVWVAFGVGCGIVGVVTGGGVVVGGGAVGGGGITPVPPIVGGGTSGVPLDVPVPWMASVYGLWSGSLFGMLIWPFRTPAPVGLKRTVKVVFGGRLLEPDGPPLGAAAG